MAEFPHFRGRRGEGIVAPVGICLVQALPRVWEAEAMMWALATTPES